MPEKGSEGSEGSEIDMAGRENIILELHPLAERFASTFANDIDQPKALIAAKARQAGIANRTVEDLIRLALSAGQLHRWTRSKSNEIRLATIPQPITETGAKNG